MALTEEQRRLVDFILEQTKAALVWKKTWDDELCDEMKHGGPPLSVEGERLAGPGAALLRQAARRMNLQRPTWLTAAEIAERHGTMAPAATPVEVLVHGRSTALYNVSQVNGLEDQLLRRYWEIHPRHRDPRTPDFDRFASTLDVTIRHLVDKPPGRRSRAAYLPGQRAIRMPPFEMFFSATNYYLTLAHELVHWADHSTDLVKARPTRVDQHRAWGELVAEFGAVFVCAERQLEGKAVTSPIDYIGHWRHRGQLNETQAMEAAEAAADLAVWVCRIAPSWRASAREPRWQAPPGDQRFRAVDQPAPPTRQRTATLAAAARARALVASAHAFGRTNPQGDPDAWDRDAARLLALAAAVDLANPAVEAAIEAAVALATPLDEAPVTAASWLRDFQERTMRRRAMLQLTRTAGERAATTMSIRSRTP